MDTKPIVSRENLPPKMPYTETLVLILYTQVHQLNNYWFWAIMIYLLIRWLIYFMKMGLMEEINIFKPYRNDE